MMTQVTRDMRRPLLVPEPAWPQDGRWATPPTPSPADDEGDVAASNAVETTVELPGSRATRTSFRCTERDVTRKKCISHVSRAFLFNYLFIF